MRSFSVSLLAGLCVCSGWAHARTGTAPSPLPDPVIPSVMGVQLKNGADWTPERIKEAHALGFRIVRKGLYWTSVEKQKGTYDFSGYDAQVACAKQLGLTVVLTLFGSNPLYENEKNVRGVITEPGRKGFAAFAAAAAAHYKGEKIIFEIWNEPNVRTFWGSHGTHNTQPFADQYAALVNETVPAMLKADPDVFVAAGSVSNYWEPSYKWTEFCFQDGVLKSGIRAWSVHPYGVKTPEEHANGHKREQALLAKYDAPDMPLINTERGFAVSKTATGEGWSGGNADKTLEYQAWQFVRQLLVDQLSGVRFSSWYEWGGNEGFSLWNPDGSPRPVVAAIKTLVAELGGFRVIKRLASDADRDYIVLCENASGQAKLAVWTAPPEGGSPDEAFPHEIKIAVNGVPRTLALTGAPTYVSVPAGATFGIAHSLAQHLVSNTPVAEPPKEAINLKLFASPTTWSFLENTGKGRFELGKDETGRAIGVLSYDFSASQANTTPYVLATAPIQVPAGCTVLSVHVRTAIRQPLTFRLTDSTGQTLQHKSRIKTPGGWTEIRIPLDKKFEHWGGANDGKPHFPIQSICLSVPRPSMDTLTGKVEYTEAYAK